jgi:hypothetical protein
MAITNRNRLLEKYVQVVREDGLNTNKNVNIGIAGATSSATLSVGVGGITSNGVVQQNHTAPSAINATATATAAQVASGYITSTSAASTTITLPTATAIATQIGATRGTVLDLFIDNTGGANTVTITPDSSMTNSQVAQVATYGVPTFGLFTVASGASGLAQFRLVFSSATALVIARVF